jgi:RNA-splicing ligase RtcB
MLVVQGQYNSAIVYADILEDEAKDQILEFCNQKISLATVIRIMPDVHPGIGCVIGATIKGMDVIVPYMVGVDIGCGVTAIRIDNSPQISLEKIDCFIRDNIPHGFDVNEKAIHEFNFESLYCLKHLQGIERLRRSLGSLGGGNHFIEMNVSETGDMYLSVHTGSRNLGKQVADYYQKLAISKRINKKTGSRERIPKNLTYLDGDDKMEYLADMNLVQKFAEINRELILNKITNRFGLRTINKKIESKHNYIDTKHDIMRKGAVSAQKNELLIIPINMKDGSMICRGKGNKEWNYSAPHGAGRIYSRKEAKQRFNISSLNEQMKGIYTSSIKKSTLDEAPGAYKPMAEIIRAIEDTVEIISILKPVYNFKG